VERALTEEERKEGIKGFFFVEKKELHVTHHYMVKGGSIKVKRIKRDIPISNTCSTKQFDQHMFQIVVRSVPRAYSCC